MMPWLGAGNYSQQNLGQMMPWGVAQMPQYGMQQQMPMQNLAMFGHAVQPPMWAPPQMGNFMPQQQLMGWPQQMQMGQQPAQLPGSNFMAALMQALSNARMQQAPAMQIPSPQAWSLGSTMPPPLPATNYAQLPPPPPPPAPAAPTNFGNGLAQLVAQVYGGGEAGGMGGGVSADAAAAGAGGMDVGSAHDTGQTETAAGAAGGFGGGGPDLSSEPGAGGLW